MDFSSPPDASPTVQLTLSRWVIFVDWHGVLSRAPFWHTILWNERHPYHREIDHRTGELFRDGQLIDAWMRGRITTTEVLEQVQVQLDRRAGEDFLARRLLADCRNMPLADDLTRTLYVLRARADVVIATDNADCFVEAAKDRRDLRFADGLLSSSDLGVLKAEDPARFFGPWLTTRGLGFDSAVLVDDNHDNCTAFRTHGGAAIHVTSPVQAAEDLRAHFARQE
ncbi:MAG: hypothetical protein ACRDT4_04260 [Micromonosporaceae bacterium]